MTWVGTFLMGAVKWICFECWLLNHHSPESELWYKRSGDEFGVINNNLQQEIKQDIPKTVYNTMELWIPIVLLVATTLGVHTTFSAAHPVPRSAPSPTVRQNVYSGMEAFGVLLRNMVCFLMSCVLSAVWIACRFAAIIIKKLLYLLFKV